MGNQLMLVQLTDYQIRDLNDEINKLIREKYHWENRILELGGPNYKVCKENIIILYIVIVLIYNINLYVNLNRKLVKKL